MMKLNAENRRRFVNIILTDVLKSRSDDVRQGMQQLHLDIVERTFGKTPQARAANRRRIEKLNVEIKKLTDSGIKTQFSAGHRDYDIRVNMAGQTINMCSNGLFEYHTVDFDREFLSYHSNTNIYHDMGSQ